MKPRTVGIIPARYSSTRFPGKMLAPILGKSLIRRTYENALRCSSLDAVVIATDDKRIFDHVAEFGGKVVMTSPDCPTGTDRLVEAIQQHRFLDPFEIVINIQGDHPCLAPSSIGRHAPYVRRRRA
jgi:3-deoxy-manno-octulosonate cytidylyltransferase (CMP-KDO synthetase)